MGCVDVFCAHAYSACGTYLKYARGRSLSCPFAHICFRLRIFVNLMDRCRYRYFTFGGSVLLFVSIVLQTVHVWCVCAYIMSTFFMGSVCVLRASIRSSGCGSAW